MTTEIAIGERDGRVILQFHQPVEWVALDPQNALLIGEAIAKSGYKIQFGNTQQGSIIRQEMVNRLYIRIEHALRSMAEKGKSHKFMAHQLVDTVLSEVV